MPVSDSRISTDNGLTFQKLGDGPVLTASLHEPFLIADAFVSHLEGHFHKWYVYGVQWKQYVAGARPDRFYKIGHAVSEEWTFMAEGGPAASGRQG
jgi:hypothetical protein